VHAGLSSAELGRVADRVRRAVSTPPAAERGGQGLTVSLSHLAGPLAYLGVFIATVIEGEVVFVAATVLVQMGKLDPIGVYGAAALGGSIGDQLYFYSLRGRLNRWLDLFPGWSRRRDLIIAKVRTNATGMILLCRFLPGFAWPFPRPAPTQTWPLAVLDPEPPVEPRLGRGDHGNHRLAGAHILQQLGVKAWWTPIVPACLVLGVRPLARRATRIQEVPGPGTG
jgi:hypothetical protein